MIEVALTKSTQVQYQSNVTPMITQNTDQIQT